MIILTVKAIFPAHGIMEEFEVIEQFEAPSMSEAYIKADANWPLPEFNCKIESVGFTMQTKYYTSPFSTLLDGAFEVRSTAAIVRQMQADRQAA